MYKAIKEIGEYKIGDEVPSDQAKVWNEMYAEPVAEEVSEKPAKQEVVEKEVVAEKPKPIKSKFKK